MNLASSEYHEPYDILTGKIRCFRISYEHRQSLPTDVGSSRRASIVELRNHSFSVLPRLPLIIHVFAQRIALGDGYLE